MVGYATTAIDLAAKVTVILRRSVSPRNLESVSVNQMNLTSQTRARIDARTAQRYPRKARAPFCLTELSAPSDSRRAAGDDLCDVFGSIASLDDNLWPKFLRDNAHNVLKLDP